MRHRPVSFIFSFSVRPFPLFIWWLGGLVLVGGGRDVGMGRAGDRQAGRQAGGSGVKGRMMVDGVGTVPLTQAERGFVVSSTVAPDACI
jgi:hypothetical protein